MRYVVIAMLIAIVASLGSALCVMLATRQGSEAHGEGARLRVGLSVTLFLMLMAGYYFGLIQGDAL